MIPLSLSRAHPDPPALDYRCIVPDHVQLEFPHRLFQLPQYISPAVQEERGTPNSNVQAGRAVGK